MKMNKMQLKLYLMLSIPVMNIIPKKIKTHENQDNEDSDEDGKKKSL